MAPYTEVGKMFLEKTNVYLQRQKKKVKEHEKYLPRKVKLGTATPDEREELANLEAKSKK